MPERDSVHESIRQALINDGWNITHDPLVIHIGPKWVFVDLGVSSVISANRDEQKIAVEIKSFVGKSDMHNLEQAVGQFIVYQAILAKKDPERTLFLALPDDAYERVFTDELGQLLLNRSILRLIVCDTMNEEIIQWIPLNTINEA